MAGIVSRQDLPEFNEEVKRASELAALVQRCYQDLNSIVQRHEERIQARWMSMKLEERHRFLLEHWPELPKSHRPDDLAYLYKSPLNFRRNYQFRWPYLNIEDLEIEDSIPILLNSRGRNHPGVFAHTDCVFSHVALAEEVVIFNDYNPFMRLDSSSSSDSRYGSIEFKFFPDIKALAKNRCYFRASTGRNILEVQLGVFAFLIEFCQHILHEHSREKLMKACLMPEPRLPGSDQKAAFGDFAVRARLLPYEKAESLDLQRIFAYVSSMLNASRDHLLAIRDDPNYYCDSLKEILDHDRKIPVRRQPHILQRSSINIPKTTFSEMVTEAYSMLAIWGKLYDIIDELHSLFQSKQKVTVDQWKQALLSLRYANSVLANKLSMACISAPKLRKYFKDMVNGCEIYELIPGKQEDPVYRFVFEILITSSAHQGDMDPGRAVFCSIDRLDTILRKNTAVQDAVTPRIKNLLAQTSVVAEWLQHCDLIPDLRLNEAHLTIRHEKIGTEGVRKLKREWDAWEDFLQKNVGTKKSFKLGNPINGKFDYPAHEPRDRETVTKMRKAEEALEQLWDHIDSCLSGKSTIYPQYHHVDKLLLSRGEKLRTPPWIEPTEEVTEKLLLLQEPLSRLLHNENEQITNNFDRSSAHSKSKKEKSSATTPMVTTAPSPDIPEAIGIEPKFSLKRREYEVFLTLFPDPSSNKQTPRCVNWHEFIRAMSAIGFRISNIQGSIWLFSPGKHMGINQSVQFHKPHHTKNEIPPVKVREYRNRLKRLYDWDANTFALVGFKSH